MKGSFADYYTVEEVNNLMNMYHENFKDIVQSVETLGETYEGNNISMITFHNISEITVDTPVIYLTALIQGNDFSGLANVFYIMKRIIYLYVHNNQEMKYLLSTRVIKIVPVLNVDAYLKSQEEYLDNSKFI